MSRVMNIDVYFDFICPWCLIGKRQLDTAIRMLKQSDPEVSVTIAWHGVQLLPQIPSEGVPFTEFYLQRLGGKTAVRLRQDHIHRAAKTVGVEINFSRIFRMPNTLKAHSFFKQALKFGGKEQNDKLLEGLFSAYFQHSEDLNDLNVLKRIAEYSGFSYEMLEDILNLTNSPFFSADTGGKGVPYFVFDEGFAIAGAQPAQVLYQAMLEVLSTQGQDA